jgi:hypothetical protein
MTYVFLLDLSLTTKKKVRRLHCESAVFTHLFFGSEIVYNVEKLANLFRCLALDHICYGLATNITTTNTCECHE